MNVQLQFRGYQPTTETLPLVESPFEHIDDAATATALVEQTLMGDEDEDGWVAGNASGEEFQVRLTCDLNHDAAVTRLRALSLPAELIDFPEGETHWTWLARASDREIMDWAGQITR
jgi:hypothetical protein